MKKLFLLFTLGSLFLSACNTPPPAFRQNNQPAPAAESAAETGTKAPEPLFQDNLDQAIEALDAAEALGIE